MGSPEKWPPLPLKEWEKTYATLHMWTQIVGKVRLALTPLVNHWWNVAFYLTPRGLTTTTMHCGDRSLSIEFDFIKHQLVITCDNDITAAMSLAPMPVAEFYRKLRVILMELGLEVRIWPVPVEVENPVPFDQDYGHDAYDREYSHRLWRILLQTDRVFNEFRGRFLGKCSPVHFFWGSFDLAVTRFSGRPAPPREGADIITREAYSHEVISHGFWPGPHISGVDADTASGMFNGPAFYAYAAPEPPGFNGGAGMPSQAFYHQEMKEWLLPYDEVRTSNDPERLLLGFMQATYEAGATLGGWDRAALERKR